MDSEFLGIVGGALLVTVIAATLIQWPGGVTSMRVSVFFCVIAAVLGSAAFGTLYQWNQQPSIAVYLLWLIALFGLSFFPAYALRHFVFPALFHAGLLKWSVVLGIAISVFFIYRFTAFYQKYEWQLVQLNHGNIRILNDEYFTDLVRQSPSGNLSSRQRFAHKFDLYHTSRLRPHSYSPADKTNGLTFLGLPSSLCAVYYVPASGTLYRAELELPQREIERLSAWRWLYPLYRHQKYHFLELLLSDTGKVGIYVANSQESKLISLVAAQEVDASTLSPMELQRYTNVSLRQNEKKPTQTPQPLFANQYSVAHNLTGLTGNVVELRAISYAGERYKLPKKYWGGRPLPGLRTPVASLRYLTYNAEGELLAWVYHYPAQELHSTLQAHGFNRNEPSNLVYDYFLRFDDNKKLIAFSYEYINSEKYEFEVDAALYSADSSEAR